MSGAQERTDEYAEGRAALEQGDLTTAARLFRAAISADPQERRKVIGRDYLPYFYLGRTLYRSGDCRGAVDAWDESLLQGVVSASWAGEWLRGRYVKCTERIEIVTIRAQELESDIDFGRQQLADLLTISESGLLREARGAEVAELRKRVAQAAANLGEAERRRQGGLFALDDALLEQATAIVREVEQTTSSLTADVERWNRAASASLQAERQKLSEVLTKASRRVQQGGRTVPKELRSLFWEADPNRMGLSEARQTRERLEELLATTPEAGIAAATVPDGFRRALAALLRGEYREAIQILASEELDGTDLVAHGFLIEAAARYYLSRLDPVTGEEHLTRAVEAAHACRLQDGDLHPAVEIFSPDFVEFFSVVVDSGASASG